MEVWKDIPEYEGLYQASTHGRVRSVEGKITSNAAHKERRWKSKILKGRGNNYVTGKRVTLWKDGKSKEWLVCRAVAMTFLPNFKDGDTVNHIDGNRMNNRISNLEWLSLPDNIRHGFRTGLYRNTQKPVVVMCEDFKMRFNSMNEADRYLGRSDGYISNHLNQGRPIRDSGGKVYSVLKEPS